MRAKLRGTDKLDVESGTRGHVIKSAVQVI